MSLPAEPTEWWVRFATGYGGDVVLIARDAPFAPWYDVASFHDRNTAERIAHIMNEHGPSR